MKITFPNLVGNIEIYMDCMRAICGDTEGKSMIDLMCAFAPNTPKLGFHKRTYVDVIDRKMDHTEEQHFFIQGDIFQFLHVAKSPGFRWDVAICSDGIEHLYKDDGHKLLWDMQRISHKQIIFTPTTDLFGMAQHNNDDPEAHRSLWSPDDFPGWASIVFPDYHKIWNGGAFFAFHSENTQEEYARVLSLIMKMKWYEHMIAE